MNLLGFLRRDKSQRAKASRADATSTLYRPPRVRTSGGAGAEAKTGERHLEAGDTGRLFSTWRTSSNLSDDLKSTLPLIRARARDLEINNDYVRKYLMNLKVNIVGPKGISLQCQFKDAQGELRTDFNEHLEREFRRWGRQQSCEVTGRYAWSELQRVVIASVARDGEAFVRLVYGAGHNAYGLSLQLIDPAVVPEALNVTLENGNKIRLGVEHDSWGRPVAYYLTCEPGAQGSIVIGSSSYARIEACDMLHVFKSDRANISRGLPWLSSVILRLKMLAGMEEASLVAARVGSSTMGFFSRKTTDDGRMRGDDDLELGGDVDGTDIIREAEPGSFELLPPGVSFEQFKPDSPKDTFAPFVKSMLRAVSSGLPAGSYNSLANDRESTSYSSLRHALLEEQDAYRDLQAWYTDVLVRPIYQAWLRSSVLNKALRISVKEMADYLEPAFVPRAWGFIDPYKQTMADVEAMNAGIKSVSQIIADQGKSFDELALELKQEAAIMSQYGLSKDKKAKDDDRPGKNKDDDEGD